MAQVRVWNDNVHPYTEQFRDQLIKIPAKQFIEMEEGEAIEFKGTYSPVIKDGNDQPLPTSYKMIRIERFKNAPKEEVKLPDHKCVACGYQATSSKDLDEHVTASHLEQMLDEKEVEKRVKTKKAG